MIHDIFDVIADAILVHARFALSCSLYRVLREAQDTAYRVEAWLPGRVAGCRCDYATRDECQNGGVLSDCPCPCHIDARDEPFEVRLHGEPVADDRETHFAVNAYALDTWCGRSVDDVPWTANPTAFRAAGSVCPLCLGGVERAGGVS